MKKKTAPRKLQLRKDTLLILTEDDMPRVAGGTTVDITCGCTEDEVCINTTLAAHCAQSCLNC